MQKLFAIILLIHYLGVSGQIVEKVQQKFPYIASSEITQYLDLLALDKSTLSEAYQGALFFLKSKDVVLPHNKLKYFNKGKKHLDHAIYKNPNNIEFRYLRLIFQYKIPQFLGYHQNKNEDFNIFKNTYKTSTHPNKKKMLRFILALDNLEETKKQILNQLL